MRKQKRPNDDEEFSIWQSAADMMTALLFIALLIILLLGLYLVYHPERNENNGRYNHDGAEIAGTELTDYEDDTTTEHQQENTTGGGGSDQDQFPIQIPSGGGGNPEDEGIKTAVYAELIDGETKKRIAQKDVTFALHDSNKSLEILNTYYPLKISYKEFKTTEDGGFYLPEKILEGSYYFKDLTPADGYDLADDTHFTVDELYDWDEAYVVQIPLYPARNIIRIQMTDKSTGKPVSGGKFDIVAAEDIITKDGTTRYTKGKVVGTIECNDNGYGESEKLYLGKYLLKDTAIPEYYAGQTQNISTTVEQASNEDSKNVVSVKSDKTQAVISVTDELSKTALEGVVFEITNENGETRTETTDTSGQIVLDNLDKGTKYVVTETKAAESYQLLTAQATISVDGRGMINGKAVASYDITNRLIRADIEVRSKYLPIPVKGNEVKLKNTVGETVASWTADGTIHEEIGLEPGKYSVEVSGVRNKASQIEVKDTAETQVYTIHVTTMTSMIALGICIMVATGLVILLIAIVRTIRKRVVH